MSLWWELKKNRTENKKANKRDSIGLLCCFSKWPQYVNRTFFSVDWLRFFLLLLLFVCCVVIFSEPFGSACLSNWEIIFALAYTLHSLFTFKCKYKQHSFSFTLEQNEQKEGDRCSIKHEAKQLSSSNSNSKQITITKRKRNASFHIKVAFDPTKMAF